MIQKKKESLTSFSPVCFKQIFSCLIPISSGNTVLSKYIPSSQLKAKKKEREKKTGIVLWEGKKFPILKCSISLIHIRFRTFSSNRVEEKPGNRSVVNFLRDATTGAMTFRQTLSQRIQLVEKTYSVFSKLPRSQLSVIIRKSTFVTRKKVVSLFITFILFPFPCHIF